ncbi:glycosyltransferase family 2 protein [Nesterenkonia salmonea]|uniref:glycosyltransferase family 2 protein n=1 Tax=Nesterenkonia salmonea TaxID=1804987 RepID=UPI00140C183C|nr:glycosyltransferase [Nesterenkonia salmonea]
MNENSAGAQGPAPSDHSSLSGLPEIVIVAYGSPELLTSTLAPLGGCTVTIVDNSSMPEIAEIAEAAGATYWDPGENLGFGAGVNYALARRQIPGSDVLLLNPDAVIEPSEILLLSEALHAVPRIACVGPGQVDLNGNRAQVTWPYPRPSQYVADAVKLGRLVRSEPRYVIGSVLLLNAAALADIGGFDEEFFLYAEEADWEYRAHEAGWRNVAVDDITILHIGGGTSSDPVRREVFLQAGQQRFLLKHHGSLGWHAARWATVLSSIPRILLFRGDRRGQAKARGSLFLHGPIALESKYRPEPKRQARATEGPP